MRISYHIGAHATDGDLLVKSLLRNREVLGQAGVSVPGPGKYRNLLRDVLVKLRGTPADGETQSFLLESILEGDTPDHLVLSNPSFISVPGMAVGENQLYPRMFKAEWLRNLFPSHSVDFHLCVRDPATFLPALHALCTDGSSLADFTDGSDPRALAWSQPVAALLASCPDARLTLWCHEDAPLIWEEVMRAVCGIGPDVHLHGLYDMARHMMNDEGMPRLRSYFAANPPANRALRQRAVTAFVETYAREAPEAETTLPHGWTEAFRTELTELYETDLARIAAMDRVDIVMR